MKVCKTQVPSNILTCSLGTCLMARILTINFIPFRYTTSINDVIEHCVSKSDFAMIFRDLA